MDKSTNEIDLKNLNKINKELDYYNQEIEKNPDDIVSLYCKAETLVELEEYDQAVAVFCQAIQALTKKCNEDTDKDD